MLRFILLFIVPSMMFASFVGKIIDVKSSEPIKGAIISDSKHSVRSDINGSFTIYTEENRLNIKSYGYKRASIDTDESYNKTICIEPIKVKALYLSFWGARLESKTLKRIMDIVDEGNINAIIVDVKNEYGSTSFKTGFNQANKYGAYRSRTIKNIDKFMKLLKSKDIYSIARIVTFKDELQASNNLDYAIKYESGEVWRNRDKMAWVDPFDKRSHNYAVSIAEEAAKVGFDEINFDYIRFPAKSGLVYSQENTQKNREKAIEDFLKLAQNRLLKYGVFISADTYGNICWADDDSNIGQTVELFEKYADYIAPMLYPSGFAKGSLGYKFPSEHPYEIVYKSIENIHHRIDAVRIRPWIQNFKDYAHKKRHYGKEEVQAQIKASNDLNTNGWMPWSPSSRYNKVYFD